MVEKGNWKHKLDHLRILAILPLALVSLNLEIVQLYLFGFAKTFLLSPC